MSKSTMQTDFDANGSGKKSTHSYQSSWMDRWVRSNDGDKQPILPGGLERVGSGSTFNRGYNDVLESVSETSKRVQGESSLRRTNIYPFSVLNVSQQRSMITWKDDHTSFSHGEKVESQLDVRNRWKSVTLHSSHNQAPLCLGQANPEIEVSSREFYSKNKGKLCHTEQQLMSYEFRGDNSLALTTPSLENFSTSRKIVTNGLDGKRTLTHSLMFRQGESGQPRLGFESQDHFASVKYLPELLGSEDKLVNGFNSTEPGSSLLRSKEASFLLHDPFVNENQPTSKSLSLQNNPVKVHRSEKFYPELFPISSFPSSMNNTEAMRIYTDVASNQDIAEQPSEFSRSTQHFLVSKNSDFSFSEGRQMFRDSGVSSSMKGKDFGEFFQSYPSLDGRCQQGVKLQPIESMDNEVQVNMIHVGPSAVCIRNESSAETDTMEVDFLQNSHHWGVTSSSSDKADKGGQDSLASQAASQLPDAELPDINQPPPVIPGRPISTDDRKTSSSNTQSLNAEDLLFNTEQPAKLKSGTLRGDSLEPEPSSRWIKRLKTSASDSSGHGTRSLKLEDVHSHEKGIGFSNIMKPNESSSDLKVAKHHGKGPAEPDQATTSFTKNEASLYLAGMKEEITLLNPWIRRWWHNKAAPPPKRTEAVVICEPESSNKALDELQRKQFPSIAAMALMGKAMSGLSPCKRRQNSSLVVWNTKDF